MAKALQCPNCGTKKRLDGLETDAFRCENCGQVLKVPPAARPSRRAASRSPRPTSAGAPPPPPRAVAPESTPSPSPSPSPSPPGPPPRPTPTTPAAPVVAAPPGPTARGATAVVPAGRGPGGPPPAPPRGGVGKPSRNALPLGVRLGAWALAVPVGLAIIGIPARVLGYLTSQKLLDVIVKHTLARFVPLLVIVILWALATTVLVEVFIEGGRWLMLRRRAARGPGGDDLGAPSVSSPPSPRARRPAGARGS
jgi:hypothetical protein